MAGVEQNTQVLAEVEEISPVEKEKAVKEAEVENQDDSVKEISEVETPAEETEKETSEETTVEVEADKENLSQQLSQTAPVAVVPPTKRVLEEEEEQDEGLKKVKVLEETNSDVPQEPVVTV